MTQPHLDRKGLKRPDVVLTELREGYRWVENHIRSVVIIFAILFGGLAVWTVGNHYMGQKEDKALNSFYTTEKKLEKKRQEVDLKKSKDKNINTLKELHQEMAQMESVMQEFPKSKAAFLSHLKLGDLFSEQKQYQEALAQYEKALKLSNGKFYKIIVLYNLGYMNELLGQCDKAIEWFNQITSYQKQRFLLWTFGYRPNAFWLSSAYFGIGRCYEKQKQPEAAKEAYLRVSDEFPATVYADQGRAFAELVARP
ncbi:MAG: tetratricopeptide repeat protein [Deltaproteobacteria bacterium]|nr:tetratricopeptide repeat protein [Deltaproteobacteria bacterium]